MPLLTNLRKLNAGQAINVHARKDEHIQRFKRASSSDQIILVVQLQHSTGV